MVKLFVVVQYLVISWYRKTNLMKQPPFSGKTVWACTLVLRSFHMGMLKPMEIACLISPCYNNYYAISSPDWTYFNLIGQDGISSWQIKLLQECSDGLLQKGRLIHETTVSRKPRPFTRRRVWQQYICRVVSVEFSVLTWPRPLYSGRGRLALSLSAC